MHLFAGCAATDLTSEETAAAAAFRRTTIVLYLNGLDGGATWTTLIRYVPFCLPLTFNETRLQRGLFHILFGRYLEISTFKSDNQTSLDRELK